MPSPLLRRRTVPLPTWRGLLLLAVLLVGVGVALAHGLYPFLAPQQPLGRGALVVEGWVGEPELAQALAAWRRGDYALLATTGGPVESWAGRLGATSWAELAGDELIRRGVPAEQVAIVPAPASAQDRTFLAFVLLRERLAREHPELRELDVFSAGPHARRSWQLARRALGPGYRVGVIAASPTSYSPAAWWRSSAGARAVVGEGIAWAWSTCCFFPGAPGTHDERWGEPRQQGARAAPRPGAGTSAAALPRA